MPEARRGSHTIYGLHVHLVWSTKYRFHVLKGEVQIRCRDLIRQTCDSLDVRILKGVVSKDHVHLHLSYPPKLSISDMVKRLKGEKCTDTDGRVCWFMQKILGRALLGNRLWSMEQWQYKGWNDTRVSGASQGRAKWWSEFYSGVGSLHVQCKRLPDLQSMLSGL